MSFIDEAANMDERPQIAAREDDVTLSELAFKLWRGKIWIILGVALGLVAAVFYLNRATFLYTATMKVTAAPSSQSSSSSRLGALGGLASLAGMSVGATAASPFDIYLETLTTENVARRLASDPRIMRTVFKSDWNIQARRWEEPRQGIRARLGRSLKQAIGVPVAIWRAPRERELAGFLSSQMEILRDAKSPVVTITLRHSNPQFAAELLSAVNREADRLIRDNVLVRSRSYADYLSHRLPTVTVAEQREALTQVLSEQEKSIMMASSSVSFAATVVSGPVVSPLPTKPNVMMVILVGILGGGIVGSSVALIDWRRLRAFMRDGGEAD